MSKNNDKTASLIRSAFTKLNVRSCFGDVHSSCFPSISNLSACAIQAEEACTDGNRYMDLLQSGDNDASVQEVFDRERVERGQAAAKEKVGFVKNKFIPSMSLLRGELNTYRSMAEELKVKMDLLDLALLYANKKDDWVPVFAFAGFKVAIALGAELNSDLVGQSEIAFLEWVQTDEAKNLLRDFKQQEKKS